MKNFSVFIILIILAGCRKSDFLDVKPNPALVVPSTLADYQALLANDFSMNGEAGYGIVPALGESGADNYFLTDNIFNNYMQPLYKKVYTWQKDVFSGEQIYDWNIPYQSIYTANVVLDGLQQLTVNQDEKETYNRAFGSALFFRAHLFWQLAQVFAAPYDKDSLQILLGIPLRLTSSLTEKLTRASMGDTYEKIITDLNQAIALLPEAPVPATNPSKAACYGLLARIYLAMGRFDNALKYADSCLRIKNELIDYNSLDTTSYYPFTVSGPETIFQCEMIIAPDAMPMDPVYARIDTALLNAYAAGDLRRAVFFKPLGSYYYFTGSYSGYYGLFAGMATDEMYLTRAECYARLGDKEQALENLNALLVRRYKTGSFTPYTGAGTPDVLRLILEERRKELCFRGIRWVDLRRLNKEGANITLHRSVAGAHYELLPNDSRYVYPIPGPVISLNPSIRQNIR